MNDTLDCADDEDDMMMRGVRGTDSTEATNQERRVSLNRSRARLDAPIARRVTQHALSSLRRRRRWLSRHFASHISDKLKELAQSTLRSRRTSLTLIIGFKMNNAEASSSAQVPPPPQQREFDIWEFVNCSKCHLQFSPDGVSGPSVPFWLTECGHIICNTHLSTYSVEHHS